MTQPALDFTAPARLSLNARLASYFRARSGEWINARELLTVAGFAAWRTRLSELRRAPYLMTIENRTRRLHGLTISEYKFTPPAQPTSHVASEAVA